MLEKIVNDIKTATKLNVYAEKSTHKTDCIVYSLYKSYDTGTVSTYRLTIKILSKTVAKAIEVKEIIDNILITKGDERKYDDITECDQNGGGVIWDEEVSMYQVIAYYDFITKSRINF